MKLVFFVYCLIRIVVNRVSILRQGAGPQIKFMLLFIVIKEEMDLNIFAQACAIQMTKVAHVFFVKYNSWVPLFDSF